MRGRIPPTITLDRNAPVALYRQIYEALRDAIVEGGVAPGTLLPSTRGLAIGLAVSRNTVLRVYEELAAEGLLVGRIGSGTEVPSAGQPRRMPDPQSILRRSQYPLKTVAFQDPEGNSMYLNQTVP